MSFATWCPPVPSRGAFSSVAGSFGLLASWIEGWDAVVEGCTDCLLDVCARGPAALDVARWVSVTAARGRPSWSTPHRIAWEAPVARLRDFSTAPDGDLVPTLVVPPQAGHDSCIVDYSPEQSQMRVILDAGLARALALDWIGATPATADCTIDDYLAVVDRAVDYSGGRVNLIGDCQGGWLAAIYAALHPERVNTLTLAGAPIDFHTGEPVINEVLDRLAPAGDLAFYEALVAVDGGVLKGEHMLAGFVMIQPGAEISRQLKLLRNLDDPAHVARYREFEDWFKHTQDIPGAFYLWIVRHLFRDNALVAGELTVRGKRVDLGRLRMPLQLLGGAADHITPPDQVFAIAEHAGTPSKRVKSQLAAGGHLGLFMGHEALDEQWPVLLAEVLSHSTP
jgi:poly(3-hydroxybutyrate) depolymerase